MAVSWRICPSCPVSQRSGSKWVENTQAEARRMKQLVDDLLFPGKGQRGRTVRTGGAAYPPGSGCRCCVPKAGGNGAATGWGWRSRRRLCSPIAAGFRSKAAPRRAVPVSLSSFRRGRYLALHPSRSQNPDQKRGAEPGNYRDCAGGAADDYAAPRRAVPVSLSSFRRIPRGAESEKQRQDWDGNHRKCGGQEVLSPGIIAIALGVLRTITQFHLPPLFDTVIQNIGNCTSPSGSG